MIGAPASGSRSRSSSAPSYTTGQIEVADREPTGISDDEIRKIFHHDGNCIFWKLCVGSARFKRSQHQADIQRVVELFHKRGYPRRPRAHGLRSADLVRSARRRWSSSRSRSTSGASSRWCSRATTPTRSRSTSSTQQLTFNQAASSDDVEANESARAITAYLQGRGYFDARVTWIRERFDRFDRVIYRIEQGPPRQVRAIEFVGNYAFDADTLRGAVATREAKFSSTLFGKRPAATSAQLAGDVERLVDLYRRGGYREARVKVSAATSEPRARQRGARPPALLVADRGDGLYVRFAITRASRPC